MPTRSKSDGNGSAMFDEEAVRVKYDLSPSQLIDLKGLMGDSSDNIKGVKGIGQVTGTRRLAHVHPPSLSADRVRSG